MTITKLDAAERQMVVAVRLLFDDIDPIPAYTLANAARELAAGLCKHQHLRQTAHWALIDHPHMSLNDVYGWASRYANFLKHADQDPDQVLEHFDALAVDFALYMACADLRALRGSPNELVRRINESVVSNAWERVYGRATVGFVDRCLRQPESIHDAVKKALKKDHPSSGTAR